jgi:hypothetical protein
MQAGFRSDQVSVEGRHSDYSRISDEADRKEHVFHFCPDCGSTVFYTEPTEPDLAVVMIGAFADPSFPPPTESGYDNRRHHWVELPDSIQRYDPELWEPVRSLYDAGRYAEAADRGRELLEAHPDLAYLNYNVAQREPRGPDSRRHRAPTPRDRQVGGLPRNGEAGLRLRSDPRRARFQGTDRPLGIDSKTEARTSAPLLVSSAGRN